MTEPCGPKQLLLVEGGSSQDGETMVVWHELQPRSSPSFPKSALWPVSAVWRRWVGEASEASEASEAEHWI